MSEPARQFVFTITAGRTGSHFLAELLAANLEDAQVFDEIIGFAEYGLNTPDISQLASFNTFGNSDSVRAFWKQKFERMLDYPVRYYVETSHVLAKAGLIENIDLLIRHGQVHLVCLNREMIKSLLSYERNFDFYHKTMWWAWYLDPHYPRNIVGSNPQLFEQFGNHGVALWYLCEMRARQAYYRQHFLSLPNLVFHQVEIERLNEPAYAAQFLSELGASLQPGEVRIPPHKNTSSNATPLPAGLESQLSQLIQNMQFEPEQLAQQHLQASKGFSGDS
jgi:hypothetical protein